VLRVFWLLEMAHTPRLVSFGISLSAPFSMLMRYQRTRVYPVVLPMWEHIGAKRPLPLLEFAWRDWGPFANDAYTATLLGDGAQCAVFDHTGIALYHPEDIFDVRQGCFLSDQISEMRRLIARREGWADEPASGVPDWLTSAASAKTSYAQLHRAAGLVWAHHVARRHCACGERLARARGGNPSVTCGGATCVTAYERRRKNVRRIAARLAVHGRDNSFMTRA
jgi:hypothetical protein